MFRKDENGQAIVILALALVALLAFAALAIDAGTLYNERREAQNAADAAALAGARQIVLECQKLRDADPGTGTVASNITDQVDAMLAANVPGATVETEYILEAGGTSVINTENPVPCACGTRAIGIEVKVSSTTQSFFAGIIGQETLGVNAVAKAKFGSVLTVGNGLYPFTRRLPADWDELAYGQTQTLRVVDDADTLPGNFGWLTWDGQNNVPALCDSLEPPGNAQIYHDPGTPDNGWTANHNDRTIEVRDWVQGAPGNKNGKCVRDWLDWHIANKTPMLIPLYDVVAEQGANSNYRVAGFAAYELQSYDFGGHDKSMTGMFLYKVTDGEWDPNSTCTTEGGVYSVKLSP